MSSLALQCFFHWSSERHLVWSVSVKGFPREVTGTWCNLSWMRYIGWL